MNTFDEAWLKAHQAKMAALKPRREPPAVIRFTLAKPLKLLANERMHWTALNRYGKAIGAEVARLTRDIGPMEPFERARVFIERVSIREPDRDNLYSSVKPLVDSLLEQSARHPRGLGFVVDDTPAHMMLEVVHVKAQGRASQCTTVTIERLP